VLFRSLAANGLHAYEISNYATAGPPSSACRHNLAYWHQSQWLAAGPSASGHAAGWRWKNIPRLTDWMESVHENNGYSGVTDLESPDEPLALSERLMTGVRLIEGFDASGVLRDASAIGMRSEIETAARSLERDGILTIEGETYTLTRDGLLLADEAGARFIAALSDG